MRVVIFAVTQSHGQFAVEQRVYKLHRDPDHVLQGTAYPSFAGSCHDPPTYTKLEMSISSLCPDIGGSPKF